MSSWNPLTVDSVALPSCHVLFQFYVSDGYLDCKLYQRSADAFLGVPYNITSYSLLLMMIAQVTGLKPRRFIHTFGDAHIYLNHIDQVKLQLTREPKKLPNMILNKEIKNIFDFKYEDFSLENYNLELELANPIITSKYYQGPLQGNLKLFQEKKYPKITGNLILENCTIDIPMLDDIKGKMPLIRFDIGIDVGKKVRLYNSYLYDIWISGNVNIGGSTRWPKVTGTVNAIRGNINYLRTVFRIREASAIFNQVGTFMPSLHLDASTKIDRTNISLKIDGPVGANNFTLSSSPEMSQQEILSLLTLRSRYFNKINTGSENGQNNNELSTLIGLGFQVGVLSGVENEIRKGLGLDEFQLVRDTISEKSDSGTNNTNQEIYNLEFGKYISDKVLVKYIMGVDYEHYAIGFRYDFNNSFSITADIDQDSKTKVGLEKRFKF